MDKRVCKDSMKTNENQLPIRPDEWAIWLHQFTWMIQDLADKILLPGEQLTMAEQSFGFVYNPSEDWQAVMGRKKYICPKHSVFVLLPGQTLSAVSESQVILLVWKTTRPDLETQLGREMTKWGPLLQANELPDIEWLFSKLSIEIKQAAPASLSVLQALLTMMIVAIVRAQQARAGQVRSPYAKVIQQAITYIQTHLAQTIRPETLAKELGVSNSALYKAFENGLGISPSAYISEQKMQYAKEQLQAGQSTQVIASALGFHSTEHFTHTFKRVTGMSVREYKKMYRQ